VRLTGLSPRPPSKRPLYALYPTPHHLSRKVVAFIDMLSAGLRATQLRPDLAGFALRP
jgi:hypothetical protein